jgi:hypothetical protein
VLLLEGVGNAAFSFLGRDEDGEPTNWMSNWDQPDSLPAAVRLEIEFAEGGKVNWPPLFAAVRIDAQAISGAGAASHNRSIQDLINESRQTQ